MKNIRGDKRVFDLVLLLMCSVVKLLVLFLHSKFRFYSTDCYQQIGFIIRQTL